jgi:hypothetical protein
MSRIPSTFLIFREERVSFVKVEVEVEVEVKVKVKVFQGSRVSEL